MSKRWGHHLGDIEFAFYLLNVSDPVSLVLDLLIVHDRFGRKSDPTLNWNLHYPTDIDRSNNEDDDHKIRKYLTDCNNNPPNSIFLQVHGETDHFRKDFSFTC